MEITLFFIISTLVLLTAARFDVRKSGQYWMINCGSDNSATLDVTLKGLYLALLPIIEDTKLSNPSPAFKAFFKDASNAPFVSEVLTNVTTGVARHPNNPPFTNGSPTFFCPTAAGQFQANLKGGQIDLYIHCLQTETSVAFYLNPLPYIVLCSKFWTSPYARSPPSNNCLSVNTYINKFRGNGETLYAFNMWILLEEIVHYYLTASSKTSLKQEVYDVNKAFRLSADKAVANAVSYSYYAASKSSASKKQTSQTLILNLQMSMVSVKTSRVRQTMGVRYWKPRTQMIHQTKGRIFRVPRMSLMALRTCK